jgi:hypothetical protein
LKYSKIFTKINRWFVFLLMTLVVAGIVLATTLLVNYLRKEEIKRINLLSGSCHPRSVAGNPQHQQQHPCDCGGQK